MARYCLCVLITFFTLTTGLNAQVITDPILAGLIKKQNSFFSKRVPEKVYIHTDKPDYITGDTIRLKAYVLDADYLTPVERSGLLYVELDDIEGKAAKRLMLPITEGVAWCDMVLDEENVSVGGYTLRAYTNWMRNFGDDYIFRKSIYVSPAAGNATLVKANFKRLNNKVEAALQFTTLDGQILRLKDMELKVTEGRKNLAKDQLNTGMGGLLNVNFETSLSPTTKPITIRAKEIIKGNFNTPVLNIPLILNRPDNTDLQFMPEGGNLVAGITTRVGFKAVSEDGKGAAIAGKILNSRQQAVATFKTGYAGMGSFEFTPVAGEIYTARANGINKIYQLPKVIPIGTVLNIDAAASDDSLTLIVSASAQLSDAAQTYYLIGRARGVVCFAQAIHFLNGQPIKKSVAKGLFPTGIARFTLHNAANVPLNERQVFIDHRDGLQFTVTNQMPAYGARDSIALGIEVKDKNNKPVQGYFSVAITDDNQVKTDSLGGNIRNNLLMTSDLKGDIETPGYYFTEPSKQKQAELDNLMLTQGWIGYNWQDVFALPAPLAYQPEKEFVVRGKATNAFGKPVENAKVVMILKNPTAVRDTLTDKSGGFEFKDLVPLDSAVIVLQARNKRGREFNISLDVEEFKEPSFKSEVLKAPWYLNMDTTLLKNSQTKAIQTKAVEEHSGEGNFLKEVQITAKRAIKGSKNLNGPGGADEILEEEVFHKANHMSLKELLMARYKKEFLIAPFYSLKGRMVYLSIDGVRVGFGRSSAPLTTTEYMNFLSAEDIKGIEIMNSTRYAMAYDSDYSQKLGTSKSWYVPIFLEITTYSGNGAYMKKVPGTYLYRPLPFTLPTEFYRPKYIVKNKGQAVGTDMRSTLHWEPNIITDAAGKATVSFYMADKPVNYTVIVEGFNGQGDVGYGRYGVKNSGGK